MSSSKSNPPKPRKRVDVDESGPKRAANGSAFIRCEKCSKDVAVAIADMHDCGTDLATRARLQHSNTPKPVKEAPKKDRENGKKRGSEEKKKKSSKKKAKKDPQMPKRPLSGFFVFMEDFRKTKKAENVSIKPSEMTKLGGERWKEMTDEEKAPYTEKAAQLKADYEEKMKKYRSGDSEDVKDNDEKDNDSTAEAEEEDA